MRIAIYGIVASGKSTLARELGEHLRLPVVGGDEITYGFPTKERFKRSDTEQRERSERFSSWDGWVFEGVLRDTQSVFFERADRIIFLDTPKRTRLRRIVTRWVRQRLGLEKAGYKPSLEMLRMMFKWTRDFEHGGRAEYEAMLRRFPEKSVRLRTKREIELAARSDFSSGAKAKR